MTAKDDPLSRVQLARWLIGAASWPLITAELAVALDVSRQRAHQIVVALEREGFVRLRRNAVRRRLEIILVGEP